MQSHDDSERFPTHKLPHLDPVWPSRADWAARFSLMQVPEHLASALVDFIADASQPERTYVTSKANALVRFLVTPADEMQKIAGSVPEIQAWSKIAGQPDQPGYGNLEFAAIALLLPEVTRCWSAWSVEAAVIEDTCADMGRQVLLHHTVYGTVGCENFHWAAMGLVLPMFVIGRLQWCLEPLADVLVDAAASVTVKTTGGSAGSWAQLNTHIPESGPLTPAVVNDSVQRAVEFFARVFPLHTPVLAYCWSWLLNPLLLRELGGSNLAAFCDRWRPVGEPEESTASAVYFAFRVRPPYSAAELKPASRLQQLVADTAIQAELTGAGWSVHGGYFELPRAARAGVHFGPAVPAS